MYSSVHLAMVLTRFHSTLLRVCLLAIVIISGNAIAQDSQVVPLNQLVLNKTHIVGSNRIDSRFLRKELGLQTGSRIDSQTLEKIQVALYSLGLFESVTVQMQKGNRRGEVNLIIDLKDDDNVLGRAAIGGILRLIYDENGFDTLSQDQAPLGFNGELIARNVFYQQHRARLSFDYDGGGIYRHLAASYGLPKFTEEGVQFDTELSLYDSQFRYLDTLGFGATASAAWTHETKSGAVSYGLAMLTNRPDTRFSFPGWPDTIIGPKISFLRETRLLSFVPTPGYKFAPYVLIPPGDYADTVIGFDSAVTFNLWKLPVSFELDTVSSGFDEWAVRTESRIELPFFTQVDSGSFYFAFNTGYDEVTDITYWGQSFHLGLRYHSSGFIADLSLRLLTLPRFERNGLDAEL